MLWVNKTCDFTSNILKYIWLSYTYFIIFILMPSALLTIEPAKKQCFY